MYCIRAKFARGEELKYISHLDTMRIFERALRRAPIPIKYSGGFNPRPLLVFGLPLAVGMTSEAEYADFETSEKVCPGYFMASLNRQMPKGLEILAAVERQGDANIMAEVEAALYDVTLFSEHPGFPEKAETQLKLLLGRKEIIVQKRSKQGLRDVDIRPLILKAEAEKLELTGGTAAGTEGGALYGANLSLLVLAGSRANLNPKLLVDGLDRDMDSAVLFSRIHRRELYIKKGAGLAVPI